MNNNGTCPEGYILIPGHERLGRYVKPHCRKVKKMYDQHDRDVADLRMKGEI